MNLEKNWLKTREHLRALCENFGQSFHEISLLAVTKKATVEQIQHLVALGQLHLGENRLGHLKAMAAAIHNDQVIWHFIGHLQCNKVEEVLKICAWVQSVDSFRLIEKLQKIAQKNDRAVNVLLQINISEETQKTGFPLEAIEEATQRIMQSTHLVLRGLMCMGAKDDHNDSSSRVFQLCAERFHHLKKQFQLGDCFDTLSMGMSNDYAQALASGATQIRIGSALFSD
jgi:pyridoxal phosphate enzyme (YggS family)